MAWRYECSDCDHRTTWMGRADAEDSRYRHHDTDHSGRAPTREQFVSNAERVNPRGVAVFLAVMLVLAAYSWITGTPG